MKIISNTIKHFKEDTLFQNAIYLMLSTGVMAFLGFFFWLIAAKLFSTVQIGLATTLISILDLITSFSLLGVDVGLIRYLPKHLKKNDQINTCISVSAVLTLFFSTIFLIGINTFSPSLVFVTKNNIFIILFILFTIFYTVNSLIESIFTAYRDTKYIFIKNTIFSVLKIILLFVFVSFGAFGIFSSTVVALIVGILFCLIVLIKDFNFKPKFLVEKNIIVEIGRYSFGNYIAGYLGTLPKMMLPILITNMINPESTAYFYMVMMIVTILWIVPQAATQSLFAEGSHNIESIKNNITKVINLIALILVPGILAIVFLGKYLLMFFGKSYSDGGIEFLQILSVSSIFVSANYVFSTILKVNHRIKALIGVNLAAAIIIIGLTVTFIGFGLAGVGWAWILGQMILSTILYFVVANQKLI